MKAERVLFLQGTAGFGGSKRSLLTLMDLLRESPYAPLVACPEEGWFTQQLDERRIDRLALPFPAWRKWLERPFVASNIRKRWIPALRPHQIALVHSNEFWWGPHAVLLAQTLDVPSVVHLRDGHHTLRKARQYRLPDADAVLAVSTELREQFTEDQRLYNRTHLLYNGIDPGAVTTDLKPAEARARFGIAPGDFAIGNVGQLCARKNQSVLLRAAGRLGGQSKPIHVMLAGQSEPGWAERLAALGKELDLKLQILGQVDDIASFYAAIDVLVHCAQREGLPRAVVEAMAAGKPVVATAAEGIADAIPDPDHGWRVPAGDEPALAAAIAEVAADPGRACRIAARGKERALTIFSLPAQRQRLLEVYSRLMLPECDLP